MHLTMSNIEIISLVVTIVCLISFCSVFTILFRHYYLTNIDGVKEGNYDHDLISNVKEDESRDLKTGEKKKKGIQIGIKIGSYLILGLILVFFGVSLYSRFSGNIIPFGDSTLIVIGSGSMSERYQTNTYLFENDLTNQFNAYDIIGITKYDSEADIDLYDVVAFKDKDGTTIVHRIISINNLEDGRVGYITQGDANSRNDVGSRYSDYVYYDDIIGFYNETRIETVGIFIIFLQSNAGIITIVAIAYCLFMFDYYNTRYDNTIEERTQLLLKESSFNLESELDVSEEIDIVYKEELIYKNSVYTFSRGKLIKKEVIEDEKTLEEMKANSKEVNKLLDEDDKKEKEERKKNGFFSRFRKSSDDESEDEEISEDSNESIKVINESNKKSEIEDMGNSDDSNSVIKVISESNEENENSDNLNQENDNDSNKMIKVINESITEDNKDSNSMIEIINESNKKSEIEGIGKSEDSNSMIRVINESITKEDKSSQNSEEALEEKPAPKKRKRTTKKSKKEDQNSDANVDINIPENSQKKVEICKDFDIKEVGKTNMEGE